MSEFDKLAKLFESKKITSDEGSTRLAFVDTGIPHLNYILSGSPRGGLPQGKMTEIAGESMSGKTVLLSQLFIAAQKMGGVCALWDHERSYEAKLSEKNGLITRSPFWLYKEGRSFEKTFTSAINYGELVRNSKHLNDNAPILIGIDSYASMIPKSQLEKEIDETTMNDMTALSRAASTGLKVYNQRASDANVTTILLNQLAANMDAGMYGPKTKSSGGKKLPYLADTRLVVHGKNGRDEKNAFRKFKVMRIEVVKSRTVFPGEQISIDLNFDKATRALSFDVIGSYVDFLSKLDIWEKSGAWFKFNGASVQGTDNLKTYYEDAPDGLEQLIKLHENYIAKIGLVAPTSVGMEEEEEGINSEAIA